MAAYDTIIIIIIIRKAFRLDTRVDWCNDDEFRRVFSLWNTDIPSNSQTFITSHGYLFVWRKADEFARATFGDDICSFFSYVLYSYLVLLPSERATFCKSCLSTCWSAEDSWAAIAQYYCQSVAKHRRDFITTWAFDIHEVRVGTLYKALQFTFSLLLIQRGMQ